MKTRQIMVVPIVILIALMLGRGLFAQSTFSYQHMQNAAAYSESMDGAAVLIMRDDSLIFEEYQNGADSNFVQHIKSATKVFWAVAAALAKQEGLISSYDEYVAQTITEWQNSNLHPGKNLIKIRHLLGQSSGLSQDVSQIQGSAPEAADIYQYVVDSLNMVAFPGNNFQYGPSDYYVFGALLQRKLNNAGIHKNPLEYLDSMVLSHLGLQYDSWIHDSVGNPHIPNGCYINAREWIKFGQFLLDKGKWNTTQIIDSILMEELFVADGPNLGHGKFVWLNNMGGYGGFPGQIAPPQSQGGFMYYDGFTDIIGAMGGGRNRMYIIPSLNVVIARQTLTDNNNFDDHTFLSYLLNSIVLSIPETNQGEPKSQVYPNPSQQIVNVESTMQLRGLQITSTKGEVLMDKSMVGQNGPYEIDISNLDNGVYFLSLVGNDTINTFKIVKK